MRPIISAYAVMISAAFPAADDDAAMAIIERYREQGFDGAVYEYGSESDVNTTCTAEVWRWATAETLTHVANIAAAAPDGMTVTLYGPGREYVGDVPAPKAN